jgi:predicted CxxxxCH...CXXCH cytochrome family protein
MDSRPVLCAGCHASNALNAKGKKGIPSLSNAIHRRHSKVEEITPDTAGCYNCHPGSKTQFLRDVMATEYNLNCTACHGTMAKVAKNKSPWLSEPRCDNRNCHSNGYRLDKPLYNQAKAYTGVYCAGCHDSPHAIAPSRQENDQIKFIQLQHDADTLKECAVCHGRMPDKPFKH